MAAHDIIVIGASLGGVDALPRLLGALPADFPASVFVVQHLAQRVPSNLAELVQRSTRLPAAFAADGERIVRSRIYLAPPDHHLEVDGTCVQLKHGPKLNLSRPAIDQLFRTAARAYGPRVIGVILTGSLDDGSIGLNAVKAHGGIAIVQDPAEAPAPGMPLNALRNAKVDFSLPLMEIPAKLIELTKANDLAPPPPAQSESPPRLTPDEMVKAFGPPLPYVCPECHGPLWEIKEDGMEFRCHVGHGFGLQSLLVGNEDRLEQALWSAVRAMEEQASLLRRVGLRAHEPKWKERADEKDREAAIIRELLQRPRTTPLPLDSAG